MARKFTMGGKAPQVGYNVSHSHRRTKKVWMPNIQRQSLFSVALGRFVRLTVTTSMLRTVDRAGGLDNYLMQIPSDGLTRSMRDLQEQIRDKQVAAA